jgi:hypothetical protein
MTAYWGGEWIYRLTFSFCALTGGDTESNNKSYTAKSGLTICL